MIRDVKELKKLAHMQNTLLKTKPNFKIINGGEGSLGANGLIGVKINKAEMMFMHEKDLFTKGFTIPPCNYSGALLDNFNINTRIILTNQEVTIQGVKLKVMWGLCEGHRLERITKSQQLKMNL